MTSHPNSSTPGADPLPLISHVLLDIEGTTCPVSFVADILFPHAISNVGPFLEQEAGDPRIQDLCREVHEAWGKETDPEAIALRRPLSRSEGSQPADVVPYLVWLMRHDSKLAPMKELQGMIWRKGYGSGQLKAPLFEDVAANLQRWLSCGLVLAVYSSGSVSAQQLLYQFSTAGDLRPLFQFWFDRRTGNKYDPASYRRIAELMAVECRQVLFISDSIAELKAAAATGMKVIFSMRKGNPNREPEAFATIRTFDEVPLTSAQA